MRLPESVTHLRPSVWKRTSKREIKLTRPPPKFPAYQSKVKMGGVLSKMLSPCAFRYLYKTSAEARRSLAVAAASWQSSDVCECGARGWTVVDNLCQGCYDEKYKDDDAKSANSSTYGGGCRRICRFCKEECSCWNYNSDHEVVCENCSGS